MALVISCETLHRDFRAFHLSNQVGVGQRIEIRERFDVAPVRLAVEEERVRLDGVEHRRRGALGDARVDGPQVLGQNGAGRSVVFADVLEDRVVAVLLGMVIDDEIDAVETGEVVRLNVDHADAVEVFDGVRRDRLDVDVEQVRHPDVLGARHPLERRDDGGRPGAVQNRAQREPAGHGVGVGLVVQQDEDAIGVGQVPLILLHPRARQRAAELGQQGRFEQFGQRQVRDVRELIADGFRALFAVGRSHAEDVDERAAGIANRIDDLRQVPAAGVLDDDAGLRRDVGFDVGIGAADVARQ